MSSTSTAAAPAAAAAAAATELEHGKLFAVLARNGVSAYASASGALAWSLDASQLSGLASSSSSGSGGAAIQWSDIVAAASGKNGQGGASGACIVGLSSSSSSNGKLAVVDLKRSSNGKGGDQGTCVFVCLVVMQVRVCVGSQCSNVSCTRVLESSFMRLQVTTSCCLSL